MITRQYKTPCGTMTLGATNEGLLCLCVWNNDPHKALKERKLQQLPKTASASAAMRTTTEEAIKADAAVTFLASAADKASEAAALTCLTSASRQLDEYFAGTRTTFDIPLHIAGTAFQKRVWQQLLKIQYGATATYKQIAERISIQQSEPIEKQTTEQIAVRADTIEKTSSKTASFANTAAITADGTAVHTNTSDVRNVKTTGGFICRAVANACAANPISIIIPCHRVIGSNNRNLTGYAGGLSAKKKLLEIEGEGPTRH